MKKPKHEAELFKAALLAGIKYAEGRGAVEFEPTDSASDKALYVYRLLVHDKIITPMPEEQVAEKKRAPPVGVVVRPSAAEGSSAFGVSSQQYADADRLQPRNSRQGLRYRSNHSD